MSSRRSAGLPSHPSAGVAVGGLAARSARVEHRGARVFDNFLAEHVARARGHDKCLADLRRRTGHPRLNVQPVLTEAAPTAKRLYTTSDKFEYLAERFPALREAKQRLGLEADY